MQQGYASYTDSINKNVHLFTGTTAGNQTGGAVKIDDADCTVPHVRFNWAADCDPTDGVFRCFQPLYRCTWNSTELVRSMILSACSF